MPKSEMVTAVASAIREGFVLLKQWLSGANARRLRKAVEIGEKMALRIKAEGIEDKKLQSWADDFFKYNN